MRSFLASLRIRRSPGATAFTARSVCLVFLVGLAGCRSQPASVPVTSVAAVSARALPASVAALTPTQTAMTRMQSQRLYRQAEAACGHKQYAYAAQLLAQLQRQTGVTAEERAFVEQQRRLCLRDAHLPAPPVSATAVSLPEPKSKTAPLHDAADCGPRALLLVCERLGVKTDLSTLRQKAGTNAEGTSLAGLALAAKAVGVKAEGVQVSREALPDVQTPALAYVNGNHFVAVLALYGRGENGTAVIHDPNQPREETVSQERLLRLCSGYLLLLQR